jgi:acrylyl-CoA reductase (NADPH)
MFKALVLEQREKTVSANIAELEDSRLPEREVEIAVKYSSLNYKDGLVLNGLGGLVKNYPHVPGIDLAGTVAQSNHQTSNPAIKSLALVGELAKPTGAATHKKLGSKPLGS